MTDFFADLEAELRGAAHRRAAGVPARRRRPRPRVALPAGLAAAAACALAAVLVLSPGGGDGREDERAGVAPVAPTAAPSPPPVACPPTDRGLRAPAGLPLRDLLEAISLLPREPAGGPLPEAATRALGEIRTKGAYVDAVAMVDTGEGISVSVVPVDGATPCAPARPVGWETFEGAGACLLAVRRLELVGTVCLPLKAIRAGAIVPLRLDRATLLLGFQPREAPATGYETDGGGQGVVRPHQGVVAQTIPDTARDPLTAEGAEKLSEEEPTLRVQSPAPPADVALLNATTTPGLAARAQKRLAGDAGLRAGRIDTAPLQTLRRSRVLYADPRARGGAATALAAVRIPSLRAEQVSAAELRRLGGRRGEEIVVLIGADARMR